MQGDERDAERDRHDDDERHRALEAHVLEAVERNVGDHRQPRIQREAERGPFEPRSLVSPLETLVVHQPDEADDQRCRRGARQSLKETLVDHREIGVEAREAQCRA